MSKFLFPLFCLALSGFVFMMMWTWFIVPLGVRPISFPHAIGIGFTSVLLRGSRNPPTGSEVTDQLVYSAAIYVVALLFGFIAHLFM